jgi:hypothetical protein
MLWRACLCAGMSTPGKRVRRSQTLHPLTKLANDLRCDNDSCRAGSRAYMPSWTRADRPTAPATREQQSSVRCAFICTPPKHELWSLRHARQQKINQNRIKRNASAMRCQEQDGHAAIAGVALVPCALVCGCGCGLVCVCLSYLRSLTRLLLARSSTHKQHDQSARGEQ